MVKGSNILLLGGAAAAVYFFGAKAFNLKEAVKKIYVTNPKITAKPTVKALNVAINLSVKIVNPASVDIPFEYFSGTIIYDGLKLSDFNYSGTGKNIVLKARTATPVEFTVSVTNLNVLWKVVNLLKAVAANKPYDTKFAVNSSIYAAGFDVPVNFVYDMKTLSVVSGIPQIDFAKRIAKKIKARRAARKAKKQKQPALVIPEDLKKAVAPAATPTYTKEVEVVQEDTNEETE